MGGQSSQQQTTSSSTQPWSVALPAMEGLLGNLQGQIGNANLTGAETGALSTLQQNANAGNPFAGQINDYATNMLSGGGATDQAGAINQGLLSFQDRMGAFADPNYTSMNNPALRAALDQIRDDVTNGVRGQFAAGGRDFSGAEANTIGRGVAAGQAPVILDQFNRDKALRQDASKSLYDAQNNTSGLLTGLNQQGLANRGQGVTASQDALSAKDYAPTQTLQLEQLRRGIPAQALGLLANIGVPIAGLGSQSSGTSTTTTQMSPLQQALGWSQVGSNLFGGGGSQGSGSAAGALNFAKLLFK